MAKVSELLDKVIMFLMVLAGAIFAYTQYQFYRISESGLLFYFSIILIAALAGLIGWLFVSGKNRQVEHEMHQHEENPPPWTFMEKASYGIVALVAVLILFNQVQISQASALAGLSSPLTFKSFSSKTSLALTGDPSKDAFTVVIPTGVPFYGEALGVTFEDPIKGLELIANLDPAYGRNKVQLDAAQKQRYIDILTTPTITCEFCCGVKTAVTKTGQPACGCKHVWAIRGLAAYLIVNYPTLSDDEIKREVVKWKGLFFPKQMIQRYIQEAQSGQYTPDIAALLLDTDEIKIKSAAAPIASGSKDSTPASTQSTTTDIDNLPNMVGGF